MVKELIKSLLGEKNTARVRRLKSSLSAARAAWYSSGAPAADITRDSLNVRQLISVHMLEKALAVSNMKYLSAVKYPELISNIARLLDMGLPPDDYTVAVSAAIIRSALATLPGHEDEKSQLGALVSRHNIPAQDYRGGAEVVPSAEILSHANFDFNAFVSSRHSVRKFRDKVIPGPVIREIVRDALYCPSACNRQPFRVYYSEDRGKIAEIIKLGADGFVAPGVHDCLIVTCDRALFSPAELDDQEYVNGGIFLGYLVMSIHAHGLGSCLFQCLRSGFAKQALIRHVFGISESEVIVCCVGIGELEDEVNVACAQRRLTETVAVSLDS